MADLRQCPKCGGEVSGSKCLPCLKAYKAAWHLKTYERRREQMLAANDKWRAENIERVRELSRIRHAANPERRQEQKRKVYATNPEAPRKSAREWYARNIEIGRENGKRNAIRWRKENPGLANAISALKRAKKLSATPGWANKFFIQEAYDLAKRRSVITGFPWHVDHVVPLRSKVVCGLHVENNLVVIPGLSNMSKGNRFWPDMP